MQKVLCVNVFCWIWMSSKLVVVERVGIAT